MTKSTFDPTIFHFTKIEDANYFSIDGDKIIVWETQPTPAGIIGSYKIVHHSNDDWWYLKEIMYHNNSPREVDIYSGRIPNDSFGFELFKNMELDLPVIQREIKINSII